MYRRDPAKSRRKGPKSRHIVLGLLGLLQLRGLDCEEVLTCGNQVGGVTTNPFH
jgi:hypothetical protein